MGHYNWSFVIRTSYSVQSRSTDVVGCLHKILKIWHIYLVSLWAFLGQIRASSSQKSAVDWITRSDGRIVFWQFGLGGSKILIQYRLLVNPVVFKLIILYYWSQVRTQPLPIFFGSLVGWYWILNGVGCWANIPMKKVEQVREWLIAVS